MWTLPPNFPDVSLLWEFAGETRPIYGGPTSQHIGLKGFGAGYHSTSSETNLHNIRWILIFILLYIVFIALYNNHRTFLILYRTYFAKSDTERSAAKSRWKEKRIREGTEREGGAEGERKLLQK